MLDGIQLRTVGGQGFEGYPGNLQLGEMTFGFAMGSQSIPDDDEGIFQFTSQMDQEPEKGFVVGVAPLRLKVHAELPRRSMGLKHQCRDGGHSIMAIPRFE